MKALLLLFVSISSLAAGKSFHYSAQLTNNDSLASNCPSLTAVHVSDDEKNTYISLVLDGQTSMILRTTGESRSCISDMICPTSVSFGNDKHYSKIVLTRNNDGNYPTTNLDGFSDLTYDLSETPRFGSYYCRYDLSAAY